MYTHILFYYFLILYCRRGNDIRNSGIILEGKNIVQLNSVWIIMAVQSAQRID